jgi:protein TonB
MDMRLVAPRISTLQVALAVSIAVHALLIGWRWADPVSFDKFFGSTPLEVILVNARSSEVPKQAHALAQASLAGGGEQAEGRATSPLPPAPKAELGDAPDDARRRADAVQQRQQQLLAQLHREMALLPPPDPQREQGTPQERDQEDRRRQLLMLLAEIEKRVNDDSAAPRKRYVSPATREASYALYYDKLRRRIEDQGTRDFPQADGQKLYGELTMNITIDASGKLVDADLVRGSGNAQLDRRAKAIVKAAAPFARFTGEMRSQSDQIVVTSRFRFSRDEGLEATMLQNQPAPTGAAPAKAGGAAVAAQAQSTRP